ncbi:hypothetical protein SKAU_G00210060 [Synaphobranchus kaupii]|uniref:Uncharacterized protein n=1 Tax=Synaphobranchus kaupii TaxID=118154 RepID=A0A9Q1F8J2_SYNKA|nr:hypothetical protein SKAU_G00210060 [Synaphobranchus kaupii]
MDCPQKTGMSGHPSDPSIGKALVEQEAEECRKTLGHLMMALEAKWATYELATVGPVGKLVCANIIWNPNADSLGGCQWSKVFLIFELTACQTVVAECSNEVDLLFKELVHQWH